MLLEDARKICAKQNLEMCLLERQRPDEEHCWQELNLKTWWYDQIVDNVDARSLRLNGRLCCIQNPSIKYSRCDADSGYGWKDSNLPIRLMTKTIFHTYTTKWTEYSTSEAEGLSPEWRQISSRRVITVEVTPIRRTTSGNELSSV